MSAGFQWEDRRRVSLRPTLPLLILLFFSGTATAHPRRTAPPATDSSYVLALAAANRFLGAWRVGDLETGMVLVSDHARHSQNPEKFEQFFSARADRGFEIMRGKGNRGRYRFPVILVTKQGGGVRRKLSEIIVVNTGKDDWAIDKLP